ncbi:MAG: HIT family protein [Candidatus Diapherotrites archaeon]
MQECIFCQIAQKKSTAFIVYENEETMAFLDIFPSNKGHTLIIPKKHYENIEEIPEKQLIEIAKTTKKVSQAIKEATDAQGFNIILNNGKTAGQLIMHLHFHIVPRFENDNLKLTFKSNKAEKEELEETLKKIKQKIK